MAAKIIELLKYRSTIRSRANGVAFPQLYRVEGFRGDYDVFQRTGDFVPEKNPAPFRYSLNDGEIQPQGLINATFTTIRGLDPSLEDGWIVIRHHMSDALAEGYLDCMIDKRMGDFGPTESIYRTREGVFSLIHRPASPGCANHLVIYVTKIPGRGEHNIWEDHHTIVLPDGSISEDGWLLEPPDED